MKITVKGVELVKALEDVGKNFTTGERFNIAKIKVRDIGAAEIELMTTDKIVAVNADTIVRIPEDAFTGVKNGVIGVDYKQLLKIAKANKKYMVTIFNDEKGVHLQVDGSSFMLSDQSEKAPSLSYKNKNETFVGTLNWKDFKNMVDSAYISASTQSSREVLAGIHFASDGNQVMLVTTDSYRLYQTRFHGNGSKFNALVPARTLKQFALCKDQKQVDLYYNNDEHIMKFIADTVILQTGIIYGNYPDTSRLIPTTTPDVVVKASKKEIQKAVERGELIAKESNNLVVRMMINQDGVRVSADSNDEMYVETQIKAENLGDNLDISFNPDYLLDGLKQVYGENVEIEFYGSLRPFLVKSQESDAEALITPVRTF